MTEPHTAIPVGGRVYWVDAIDWPLRNFHGFTTERGSTYNAFLVVADKVTLVDTVKAPFAGEMFARIASVVPPGSIDYVISNHAEMDHSGALPIVMQRVQPEKVFASAKGVDSLAAHGLTNGGVTAVSDGETLDLGGAKFSFHETRMLHWPDSMVTFLEDDGILFSQDAFGCHLASTERFADELDLSVLEHETAAYFANILMPYAGLIDGCLKKLAGLIPYTRVIAPDHGPIYRRDIRWILDRYASYAAQKPARKAVVVYDTMWDSTAKMAEAVVDGLRAGGCPSEVFNMQSAHRSGVATALLKAGALIVGSPTMNGTVFPSMADLMTYLRGLRPRNLVGASFGSYGWSGEAPAQLEETLAAMGVEIAAERVRANYVPTRDDLSNCRRMGEIIARRLDEVCAGEEAGAGKAVNQRSKSMQKYVCDVCGYVYDPAKGDPDHGVAPGTAFADLPDSWVCPLCGVPTSKFSPE